MNFVDLAACGDFEGVKTFLENKSAGEEEVNILDKDGRSAYHYACLNDDVKLLGILIADDRINIDLRSPKGDSGLHMASLYAALRAMEMLLNDERGKKLLNATNKYGETPLHLCAGSGDKGAAKAAQILLNHGASLLIKDQWGRGPKDLAYDNAENQLINVFKAYLDTQPAELRQKVDALTAEYKQESKVMPKMDEGVRAMKANMLLAGIGGAKTKLKKVEEKDRKVKHMFKDHEGKVTSKKPTAAKNVGNQRKILSKLIDFPGDEEEIKKHVADANVDIAGADSFGMTALHKFASWNKTELMDLIVPKLSEEQLNAQDPNGKTALHWAVELAAVASVAYLSNLPKVNKMLKDKNGKTPLDILNSSEDSAIVQRVKKALLEGK